MRHLLKHHLKMNGKNHAEFYWLDDNRRIDSNLVVDYVCISSCCCKSIVLGMGYEEMVESSRD